MKSLLCTSASSPQQNPIDASRTMTYGDPTENPRRREISESHSPTGPKCHVESQESLKRAFISTYLSYTNSIHSCYWYYYYAMLIKTQVHFSFHLACCTEQDITAGSTSSSFASSTTFLVASSMKERSARVKNFRRLLHRRLKRKELSLETSWKRLKTLWKPFKSPVENHLNTIKTSLKPI